MIATGLIRQPPLASKLISAFASNPIPNATSTALAIAGSVWGLNAYTWYTVIRGYLDRTDQKNAVLEYSEL